MSGRRSSAGAARRRSTFKKTAAPVDPRNRLIGLLVVFVVAGAGLVATLVDLQTVRPDQYRSLGEDQRTRERQITGYRGSIIDRNGFVLAAPTPSHQIVADPKMILDPDATAGLLGPILGIDRATLAETLVPVSDDDRYRLLARNVDDEAVTQIQHLDSLEASEDATVGIFIRPEEDRVYPAGELAEAVVGRVDPDEQGIFGIEQLFDEAMTGTPGTERYERGRFGSISVGDWKVDPATAGDDVVLTIDHRIQYVAEQTLLEHCRSTGAEGLTAMMADPRTGEVLAMASVVRNDEDECVVPSYNPALVHSFEPGSVVKPLVVAAVTEERGLTADTLVDVPSRLSLGGKTFVDHPAHAPAPFPVSQVLADSMNVGTIQLSQQIPAETLHGYFTDFGLGRRSGLGFEGEAAGSIRHPDDWWGADYGSIPIGQGVTVNASQLLTAYNALANGGQLVQPYLVSATNSANGSSETTERPEAAQVVSAETAHEVTRSLEAVVSTGTGQPAAVDGYRVAGKTGTAWKVFDDGSGTLGYGSDGDRRYMLTFVGFLPVDDPQVSLVVVVDEPEGTGYLGEATASACAAPVFSEIASYAVRILGIPPEHGVELAATDGRVRGTPAGWEPLAPQAPPAVAESTTPPADEDSTTEAESTTSTGGSADGADGGAG